MSANKHLSMAAGIMGTAMISVAASTTLGAAQKVYQWNGTTDANWNNASNWNAVGVAQIGDNGGVGFSARLNVNNNNANTLTYTAAMGTTYYNTTAAENDRGLVIGSAINGSFAITGGVFHTKSNVEDLVGNANARGIFTIDGGAYQRDGNLTININTATVGNEFTINGGSATISGFITMTSNATGSGYATINLNGGTLTTNQVIVRGGASAHNTFNFDGGTLKAGTANQADFFLWNGNDITGAANPVLSVKTGGASVDTNGRTITITQALRHDPDLGTTADGGLAKLGTGTLNITGANTYTGDTTVNTGTLGIASAFLNDASTVSVASGAFLALNFTGTDTVDSLVYDNVPLLPGTYSASNTSFLTGTGFISVAAAVPEPASLGLIALGGLAALARRSRKSIV